MVQHKQAFTIIELLVVVLIIGVLAAVALPQYRVAVGKSRIASDLAILRSLAQARQVYRLATGQVNCNLEELDIGFSYIRKAETNYASPYKCNSATIRYTLKNGHSLRLCNGFDGLILDGEYCTIDFYTYGIDESRGFCYSRSSLGERICKSFGEYYKTIGSTKYYKFH